jgi:hypothetical protein
MLTPCQIPRAATDQIILTTWKDDLVYRSKRLIHGRPLYNWVTPVQHNAGRSTCILVSQQLTGRATEEIITKSQDLPIKQITTGIMTYISTLRGLWSAILSLILAWSLAYSTPIERQGLSSK